MTTSGSLRARFEYGTVLTLRHARIRADVRGGKERFVSCRRPFVATRGGTSACNRIDQASVSKQAKCSHGRFGAVVPDTEIGASDRDSQAPARGTQERHRIPRLPRSYLGDRASPVGEVRQRSPAIHGNRVQCAYEARIHGVPAPSSTWRAKARLMMARVSPPMADGLQAFLSDIAKVDLLTAAQEVELAKRIERGDHGAKQEMIGANLRVVVSIAKRYRNH